MENGINLKKTSGSEYGIWKSIFCVNATTDKLHNEEDCSYTVVTVPEQNCMIKKRFYNFLLKINESESIYFEMNHPISFIWSGKLLVHRQFCNVTDLEKGDYFYNLSTYTNQRIFNHVKNSFARINNKK